MSKGGLFSKKENFENLYRKVINSMHNPIFLKDQDHNWMLLNDAFCDFLGVEHDELIGRSDYDYFPKSEADEFWEKDNIVLKTGSTNINEESFTNKDGQHFTILTSKVRIEDENSNHYILGTITDITDMKSGEAELARRNIQIMAQKIEIENAVSELQQSTEQFLSMTQDLTQKLMALLNKDNVVHIQGMLGEFLKTLESVQKVFSDSIGIQKISLVNFLDQLFNSTKEVDSTNVLLTGDPVVLTRQYLVPIGVMALELIKSSTANNKTNEIRLEVSRNNADLNMQIRTISPILDEQSDSPNIQCLKIWLEILTDQINGHHQFSARHSSFDLDIENIRFITRSKSELGSI